MGRAWTEEGKARVARAGLGPTGVSGVSPRHKRPGSGGPLRCLAPLVQGGGHISSPQPLIASLAPPPPPRTPAVCTPGRGLGRRVPDPLRDARGGAKEHPPRAPPPSPPRPYLAFPVVAATPCPAGLGVSGGQPGARPGGRAAPGDAGSRPHGGRRKRRSAPPAGQSAEPRFLPLCGRARPPSAPGPRGAGNTLPPAAPP